MRAIHVQIVLVVLLSLGLMYSFILTCLAGSGTKPFMQKGGFYGVGSLATCLMPENFYYYIIVFVYLCLFFIGIHVIIVTVMDKANLRHEGQSYDVLSLPFLVLLIISVNLYTGLLFAEDRLNASLGFTLTLLLLITNCVALCYATTNFYLCAKILYQVDIINFGLGIAVLNAMAFYVGWSVVQFFNSFTVLLVHEAKSDMSNVCTGMLIVLLLLIVLWFIIENTILISSFNTIGSHHLVIVWYLATLYPRQQEDSPKFMIALLMSNLVLAVIALLLRLVILYRNNRGNKMYKIPSTSVAVSQDIALI